MNPKFTNASYRWMTALCGTALLVATALLSTSTSAAGAPERKSVSSAHASSTSAKRVLKLVYKLTLNKNFCLEVDANTIEDGGRIQIWSCNGNSNQQWVQTAGFYVNNSILSVASQGSGHTPSCIDNYAGRYSNGNKIQLWHCMNQNNNQAWDAPGGLDGSDGPIRASVNIGWCLNVYTLASTFKNGDVVNLWKCNGESQQEFTPYIIGYEG